jgi:membrane protease subunit HflC
MIVMTNPRILLLATVAGLILFSSLCLFTVAPYEHVLVESFGQRVDPLLQLTGDPPSWVVTELNVTPEEQRAHFRRVMARDFAVSVADEFNDEEYKKLSEAAAGLRAADGRPGIVAEKRLLGPGLYLKLPAPLHRVHRFSNRINVFKESLGEFPTDSNEPIMIQPYLIWQVRDPLLFWKSVGGDERQVDEKLESQLKATVAAVVSKHPVADFYSLDENKRRALAESVRRRLLAVPAPKEIEARIAREVDDFRRRRLMGRMSHERFRRLADEAVKAGLKVESPELAEMVTLCIGQFADWRVRTQAAAAARNAADAMAAAQAAQGGAAGTPTGQESDAVRAARARAEEAEKAAKAVVAEYERRLAVPLDALRRAGVKPEGLDKARALARDFAAEDFLFQVGSDFVVGLAQRTQDGARPVDADKWKEFWNSGVAKADRAKVERSFAEFSSFASAHWGWKGEEAAKAMARTLTVVHAQLLVSETANAVRVDQARRQGAQTAPGYDADAKARKELVEKLVAGLAEARKIEKPDAQAVKAEAMFAALLGIETEFLAKQDATLDEAGRAQVGDPERGRAQRLPQILEERDNALKEFRDRLGDALPADRAEPVLAEAARRWAAWDRACRKEIAAFESKQQDIRGYPRAVIEELRKQAEVLQGELLSDSLSNRNEVRIREMEAQVRNELNRKLGEMYGVTVREVGFRRLSFPPSVAGAIYSRMKKERERVQRVILAMGALEAKGITVEAERKRKAVLSDAEAEAKRIVGEGTAAAAQIINSAVDDADLYRLLAGLNTLEAMLNKGSTTVVLQAGQGQNIDLLFGLRQLSADGPADQLKKAAEGVRGSVKALDGAKVIPAEPEKAPAEKAPAKR